MKVAGTGANFPYMPVAQRVLETSLVTGCIFFKVKIECLNITKMHFSFKGPNKELQTKSILWVNDDEK
jgi:hypothetical protein